MSLGAIGGWSECTVQNTIPNVLQPVGIRSPADGQADDDTAHFHHTTQSKPLSNANSHDDTIGLPSNFSLSNPQSQQPPPTQKLPWLSMAGNHIGGQDEASLPELRHPDGSEDIEDLNPSNLNPINIPADLTVRQNRSEFLEGADSINHQESNNILQNPSSMSSARPDLGNAGREPNFIPPTVRNHSVDVVCSQPLDVIPRRMSADIIECSGQDSNHPDVIGISNSNSESAHSNSHDNNPHMFPSNIDNSYRTNQIQNNEPSPPSLPVVDSLPQILQEHRLLPDLMSMNADNFPQADEPSDELPEPAIVTENALQGAHTNEPAIVMESQSLNRIPEVVNVHRTAEQGLQENIHCYQDPNSAISLNSGASNFPNEAINNICDNMNNEEPQVCSVNVPECDPSRPVNCNLPDISVVNSVPISFNPCADISDADLDAELAELEEEQAILQGAYGNNVFHSNPIVPTLGANELRNNSGQDDLPIGPDVISSTGSSDKSDKDLADNIESSEYLSESESKLLKPDENSSQSPERNVSINNSNIESISEASDNLLNQQSQDDQLDNPQCSSIDVIPTISAATALVKSENNDQNKGDKDGLRVPAGDDTWNESSGTDTVSSSSTLTEGDSPVAAPPSPPTAHEEPPTQDSTGNF